MVPDFAQLRERMVQRQIAARGLRDPLLLSAFRGVPRDAFVDPADIAKAYGDHPLPIAAGQTISQPYIVALMIAEAGIRPGHRVLEVGAGSGYAAAVVAHIAAEVIGVERQPQLVALARERLDRLGYRNVSIVEGDGTCGWAERAPYDAILAAATGSHVPQPLLGQLAPGGRLVMPIGDPEGVQRLVKLVRGADGELTQMDLGPVRFVPLIGEEGWRHG
jgi:protein-L-isoaspartate(D-aspartate) O-methyltransferase